MRILSLLLLAATVSFAIQGYEQQSVSGREIHVHTPPGLADGMPLLISCHGMDQDPSYQQQNTNWEKIADTAGFVVVYPRGGTSMSTWDISGDSDAKFMLSIIDEMNSKYKIDRKRVYLSGFSMGGMFSYNAISYIADKIAAIAPTSGYNVMGYKKAQRAIPIFHTHGTGDQTVDYSGLEGNFGKYREQFNCPSKAVEEKLSGHSWPATLYTWGPCDDGIYVKHLKFEGRGHHPSLEEGPYIWNFVKQYSLDGVSEPIVVPTDRDTVFNGSFSDSLKLAGWALTQHAGAGSVKHNNGQMEITVSETGTNAYDIQVIQKGMHYEKGQSYKLTFDAYASTPRSLEVNLEKDTDPWTSYSTAKTFDLGTEAKTYEITFTMNEATDTDGRISINAGLATGTVYIDNVVLKKIDAGEASPIASQQILVVDAHSYKVFDIKGQFVCALKATGLSDVRAQLAGRNVARGLYMVKKGSSGEMISVK